MSNLSRVFHPFRRHGSDRTPPLIAEPRRGTTARAGNPTARAWRLLGALWLSFATLAAGAATDPAGGTVAAPAREHRIALIIGNGRYASSPLLNPVNDARAMSKALRTMGFSVTLLEDANMKQMSDAARDFGDGLQRGGVGLFYYAGHGMQIKGRNYLIPVGADIQREDEVSFNAFDAALLLEKMEAARSRVNIVILDACRNNPFSRSFRSGSQGLAQMDAPVGSYLSFATAPARVASDGKDGNGLYTQHLLEAMRTPGLKIEEVFKRVRVKVMADSEGQQIPWDNSSLAGDFYFIPPGTVTGSESPTLASVAPILISPPNERARAAPADADPAPAPVPVTVPVPVPVTVTVTAIGAARNSESPLLHAKAATTAAMRPPTPAAPKHDRANSEAAVASYKRGLDAKSSGDLAAAADAFGRAADSGHAAAQYEMALLFKSGRKPITQDLARSQRLFLQAAEQGNVSGQYEVAQMFAQGLGGPRNCAQATRWALKAAEAGSTEAAVLAGELNKVDCAGAKNPQEAARWFRVAADKGIPNAQFSLGVLYMNGDGVPKDLQEARRWLSAAASKGNASARFYLERLGM